MKQCKRENCDRTDVVAKGLCWRHYQRDRRGLPSEPKDKPSGCKVDGCNNKHSGLGYCAFHYRRFKRGIPLDIPLLRVRGRRTCNQDNCTRPVASNGLCNVHRNRLRLGYDMDKPIKRRRSPNMNDQRFKEWFESNLIETEEGCLVWEYPQHTATDTILFQGEGVSTYRVAWYLEYGDFPEGNLKHTCKNNRCCRIDHLTLYHPKKISKRQAAFIRKAYYGKSKKYAKLLKMERKERLARQYGVSVSTISRVVYGLQRYAE